MNQRARFLMALGGALLYHGVVLSVVGWHGFGESVGLGGQRDPIVLNLQPEPQPLRQFVDTYAPSAEPAGETDLISTENSRAQDMSDVEGTRLAPYVPEPSDFDEAAPPAVPPTPLAPEPSPTLPAQPEAKPAKVTPPERTEAKDEPMVVASRDPEDSDPTEIGQTQTVQAAQPPAPPQAPPQTVPGRQPRGRLDGGVKNEGFLGFEAMRHELAPYLKQVRDRVEKRWISALEIYYRGTQSTQAVVDCAISPDGKLVRVEVIDTGNAVGYAALCRDAIAKAAPFPPFPFQVPEIYRNKNLEIRWTFSFL